MVEYCEIINPESIQKGAISVDTASEFFAFISVCYEDDNKFNRDINKLKEIIEDSFHDFPTTIPPSGLSNDECKFTFNKELKERIVQYSHKHGQDTYQE